MHLPIADCGLRMAHGGSLDLRLLVLYRNLKSEIGNRKTPGWY
jgi:hypothetical protein